VSEKFDLIIKNGQVMTSGGLVHADIGVTNGKIITIGSLSNDSAKKNMMQLGYIYFPE
jgi:dihydroorotase